MKTNKYTFHSVSLPVPITSNVSRFGNICRVKSDRSKLLHIPPSRLEHKTNPIGIDRQLPGNSVRTQEIVTHYHVHTEERW